MEDKFFNIDEEMIEYSEMTSFDFASDNYLTVSSKRIDSKYSNQPYTFKYGNYDVLDMLKSTFSKTTIQEV